MKLEIKRKSLEIQLQSPIEEAFIEDVLWLMKDGDAAALVRKDNGFRVCLETAPLDEHVGEIVVTEEKVCRWKRGGRVWLWGCCELEEHPLLYLSSKHPKVNFCPNCGGRIVTEDGKERGEE